MINLSKFYRVSLPIRSLSLRGSLSTITRFNNDRSYLVNNSKNIGIIRSFSTESPKVTTNPIIPSSKSTTVQATTKTGFAKDKIDVKDAFNSFHRELTNIDIDFNLPKDKIIDSLVNKKDIDILERLSYLFSKIKDSRDWAQVINNNSNEDVDRVLVYSLINSMNGKYDVLKELCKGKSELNSMITLIEIAGRISRIFFEKKSNVPTENKTISMLIKQLTEQEQLKLFTLFERNQSSMIDWLFTLDSQEKSSLGLSTQFYLTAVYSELKHAPTRSKKWLRHMLESGLSIDEDIYIDFQHILVAVSSSNFSNSYRSMRSVFDPHGFLPTYNILYNLVTVALSPYLHNKPTSAAVASPSSQPPSTISTTELLNNNDFELLLNIVEKDSKSHEDAMQLYRVMLACIFPSKRSSSFHNNNKHQPQQIETFDEVRFKRGVEILKKVPEIDNANVIIRYLVDCGQSSSLIEDVLKCLFENKQQHTIDTLFILTKSIPDLNVRAKLLRPYLLRLDSSLHTEEMFYELLIKHCIYDIKTLEDLTELFALGFQPNFQTLSTLIKRFANMPWIELAQRYNFPISSSNFIHLMRATDINNLFKFHQKLKESIPINRDTYIYMFDRYAQSGHVAAVRLLLEQDTPSDLSLNDIIFLLKKYPSLPVNQSDIEHLASNSTEDFAFQSLFDIAIHNGHLETAQNLINKLGELLPPHLLDVLRANLLVAAAKVESTFFTRLFYSEHRSGAFANPVIRHAALFAMSRVSNIRNIVPMLSRAFGNNMSAEEMSYIVTLLNDEKLLDVFYENKELSSHAITNIIIGLSNIKAPYSKISSWIGKFIQSEPSLGLVETVLNRLPSEMISNDIIKLMKYSEKFILNDKQEQIKLSTRITGTNLIPKMLCKSYIHLGQYDKCVKLMLAMTDYSDQLQVIDNLMSIKFSDNWIIGLLLKLNQSDLIFQSDIDRFMSLLSIFHPSEALNAFNFIEQTVDNIANNSNNSSEQSKEWRFKITPSIVDYYHLALAGKGKFRMESISKLGLNKTPVSYIAEIRNQLHHKYLTLNSLKSILELMKRDRVQFKKPHYLTLFSILSEAPSSYKDIYKMIDFIFNNSDVDLSHDQVAMEILCSFNHYKEIVDTRLLKNQQRTLSYRLLCEVIDKYTNPFNSVALSTLYVKLINQFPSMYNDSKSYSDITTRNVERSINYNLFYNINRNKKEQ